MLAIRLIKVIKYCLFIMAISAWGAEENIDNLLGDYAQKADLSEQTRKESAGILQVYTRQDLDRMQVHQLLELLEKIPFFRYSEDNYGLTNPFYTPYQPPIPNSMRVYINDRAITGVFTNDGLRLFGQMDMTFIDHVEIYLGMPSQNFGIEGAYYVVKLYTKDPDRENTTLTGAMIGSNGTTSLYGYQAKKKDDFSYLAYGSYTNLKRENVTTDKGNVLKRNKEYLSAYGEIRKGNHRIEMQAITGDSDAFMGDSPSLNSVDPYFTFNYFYGGWYYENPDNGLKAFANLTYTTSKYHDKSYPPNPLGYYETFTPPYVGIYYEDHSKINETFADFQLKKTFYKGSFKSETGIQARYKHFTILDTPFPASGDYDTEWLLSFFTENSYLLSTNHMFTASLKVDRSIDNGAIEDRTLFSGRLGYIYNNKQWTSKTFAMYADAAPVMQTYYTNRYYFHRNSDPDIEHGYGVTTQLIYRLNKTNKISFMASRLYLENTLYLATDVIGRPYYGNLAEAMHFTTYMLEYEYHFSPLTKVSTNLWESINDYRNNFGNSTTYGGLISFITTWNRFDFHSDLVYKDYASVQDPGYDLNLAITYHYSRVMTFFTKANNLLGEALKENYYVYDPLTNIKTDLPDVDVLDKRVWIGMEYQF